MAGTFASSLVAIETAKDTVISADGAFVDKKTGALISTENPHITTKVFKQVQALEGLLSNETNDAALHVQKAPSAHGLCRALRYCQGSICGGQHAYTSFVQLKLIYTANFAASRLQGDNAEEAAKLPSPATKNESFATTKVLVSPKGEVIAIAPLTNDQGSMLSACVTPTPRTWAPAFIWGRGNARPLLPSSSTPFAHNPHIRSRTCSRLVLARFSPVPPPATLTGQASPSRPTRPSISRTMIPKVLARLLMPTLRSSPRFCPYPSTI